MKTTDKIRQQLAANPVLLYMKGSPDQPQCGFSGRTVVALRQTGSAFAYVDVLQAPLIREALPEVSQWPTFPQLFINGELVGGCDIIEAMSADGSLAKALLLANADGASDPTLASGADGDAQPAPADPGLVQLQR